MDFLSIFLIVWLYNNMISFKVVCEACDQEVMSYDRFESIMVYIYSWAVFDERYFLMILKQLKLDSTFLQI